MWDLKILHAATKTWYSQINKYFFKEKNAGGEPDGGGVGGCGVYLSPQIYQEYTFRHRSAYRTPAEGRQEDLTRGKKYIEPCKTQ